jgi:hypothetical protein
VDERVVIAFVGEPVRIASGTPVETAPRPIQPQPQQQQPQQQQPTQQPPQQSSESPQQPQHPQQQPQQQEDAEEPDPSSPSTNTPDNNRYPKPVINERRIRTLLKHNCAGKAANIIRQVLANSGVAPINTATAASIQALFPSARPNGDTLPQPQQCPVEDRIELTPDEILQGLQDLPKQSAAGLSGWTYDLLRELGTGSGPEAADFRAAVRRVFNLLLRGAYNNPVDWNGDRVVPLVKKDGGVRPIVIGEAWTRVLSRIVAKRMRSVAAEIFAPHQFGVGIPGGAEIIAHVIHMSEHMLEDDNRALEEPRQQWAIQTIDFRNAFNSIHRNAIYSQLEIHLPGLIPFFRFIYARPSHIHFNDGTLAAVCGTGVKQGDPLGPLYFALALQPVLVRLSTNIINAPAANTLTTHPSHHRSVLAFLDDITLLAPRYVLRDAVDFLRRQAGRIGLELNTRKSVLWHPGLPPPDPGGPMSMDDDGTLTGTAYTHQGIATLGTAIGTTNFHRLTAVAEVQKVKGDLLAIQTLSPDLMVPLIHATINTVPMYLARTSLPTDTDLALHEFDAAVDAALLKACGSSALEAPQALQMVRGLPARDGGLSIPRLHLIRTIAYASSFLAANAQLTVLCPLLVHRLQQHSACLAPILDVVNTISPHLTTQLTTPVGADVRTLVYWTPSPEHNPGEPADAAPEAPKQKELLKPFYLEQRNALRTHLLSIPDRPGLAFTRSCRFGSSTAPFYLANIHFPTLTPAAYQSALSMRLLLRKQLPPGQQFLCSACHATVDGNDNELDALFHCLSCQACQDTRTNRHNAVRDVLQSLLERLFGARNVTVEEGQQQGQRRTDITLQHDGGVTLIDVAVVSPTTAQAQRSHSCDTTDAAASMIEDQKRQSWLPTLVARQLAPEALVPFVMESTGRFGPSALKFLKGLITMPGLRNDISAEPTISFFKKQMQARIMIGNHIAKLRCGSLHGPSIEN